MSWMMFIFGVLMALSTNGANEGMNGSDLNEVRAIWGRTQSASTAKPLPRQAVARARSKR